MKKNLILFLIAVGLGLLTYFYQELPDRKEVEEKEKRGALLDPEALGELKGIGLPEVKITKQGEQYLLPLTGELVDERKIEWFMNILSKIKMRRLLPDENWTASKRKEFFPSDEERMEFIFQNGRVTFLLGKKLEFDRSFYIEVDDGKKVSRVVAIDSGVMDAVYDKEAGHRADHYYRRFQSLFYLKPDFFRDYRIFRHWMNKKWSFLEVNLDNRRNIAFSVNFKEAKTNPSTPFFLGGNLTAMRRFEELLAKLEGKSFALEMNKDFENEPLAKMVVNSTRGEARFTLLKSKRDKAAYFLKSSLDNNIYRIEKEHADLFLLNVQDFWDLKVWKQRPEKITLGFGESSYTVQFKTKDGRFHAQSNKGEAKHASFKALVDFLSREASYWIYDTTIRDSFIPQFTLDWGFGSFFLGIRSGEIVLYHKESKQAVVYKLKGSPPIKMIKEDYINE